MRLLVVSQYFWPEDFRINELAASLVQRGHDVTVLTSVPNYPEGAVLPDYARNPAQFGRYEGAEVLRVPQIVRGKGKLRLVANYISFALSASVLGAWRLRGRAFDGVFVFQTSPVTVGIPGGLIARLKGAPMLMWILDCWPETLKAIGVGSGRVTQAAVGALVRAIYASADLLLGQSRGFEANVARYGRASKFRHFPNWVEATYLAEAPAAPRSDARRPFVLMFAGNIGEAQDLTAVIDAVARVDRPHLLLRIVGDGRDLPRVRAHAAARALSDRVIFEGRHPASAMPGYFAQADALLVSLKPDPLFAMTVPGKVQTYLAAGLPILAMLDGEGAAVVREADAGIAVGAGDSDGLAAAILRLMDMAPQARAAMGARGRRYALQHYRLERLVQQLEAWFAEAAASARGPAHPALVRTKEG